MKLEFYILLSMSVNSDLLHLKNATDRVRFKSVCDGKCLEFWRGDKTA
jgi:hypothetical protein